jgi:MFS family permease
LTAAASLKGMRVFLRASAVGLMGYLTVSRIVGAAFPVAFVICLAHIQGYGAAGLAQAVTVFTLAFCAPLQARMVDRWGRRIVLPVQATVSGTSLLAVAVAIGHLRSLIVIVALSMLAAVSSPAIDPAVRTSWRAVAEGDEQLALLHTADSLLEEAGFLVGPVLAATVMLTIGYVWAPVVLAGALLLNNLVAFCYPTVRMRLFSDQRERDGEEPAPEPAAHSDRPAARFARMIFGPILDANLRVIIGPLVLMGCTFGVLAIALPDIAAHHGSMAAAGFLLALISFGGIIGGLVYASVGRRGTPLTRHAVLGLLFGGPVAILCIARSPWAVGVILACCGLAVTPFYINSYLMIDTDIAQSVKHEANSWVPVGNDVGYIAGISLAALLVPRVGLSAAMWAAGLFGVALVLLSARSLLRRRAARPVLAAPASKDSVA